MLKIGKILKKVIEITNYLPKLLATVQELITEIKHFKEVLSENNEKLSHLGNNINGSIKKRK